MKQNSVTDDVQSKVVSWQGESLLHVTDNVTGTTFIKHIFQSIWALVSVKPFFFFCCMKIPCHGLWNNEWLILLEMCFQSCKWLLSRWQRWRRCYSCRIKKRPGKPTEDDFAKLTPMSAFGLRNRYLSRLGAQVYAHTHTHTPLLIYSRHNSEVTFT